MDVRLGVTVEGAEARIALLDAAAPHAAIDQSVVDLSGQSFEALVSTVVSTDRLLTESGHRLVGTSVCSADSDLATHLRAALIDAGLSAVTVVRQSDAITAVTRSLVDGETTASLMSDDHTAALSIIDASAEVTSLIAVEPIVGGDRGAAYRTLLERFGEEPGGATSVIVLGAPIDDALTADLSATSPVPLRFPDQPEFAIARGAALAALRRPASPFADHSHADLDAANTVLGPQAQQLAYSEVDGYSDFELSGVVPMQTPMQPLSAVDPEEVESDDDDPPAARPRALLLGSTVAALVVVGFATLAVSVALNIRPESTSQAVRSYEESVAGKYFPVAPGQGVTPDGPAWTMVEELPPPGVEPEARTFRTQSLSRSVGTGDTGAEVVKFFRDGTIGVVPNGGQILPAPPGSAPGFGGVPEAPAYVTRLIPDFSRWSPCQVLALVGNMRLLGETAIDAVATGVAAGADTATNVAARADSDLPDLEDLGKVAVVPDDKGTLFDTTDSASATGADLDAIPDQIFKSNAATPVVSDVLPDDTKILEVGALQAAAPDETAEGAPSASVLGTVLPKTVTDGLPGTRGSLPVDPDLTARLPDTALAVPGGTSEAPVPWGKAPAGDLPGAGPVPGVSGPKLGPLPVKPPEILSPDGVPAPGVNLPGPKVDLPSPKVDLPVVDIPIDPPVIEAPIIDPPAVQAPVIQAPVIDPPVFEAPVIEAPVIEEPVFDPPVIEAPVQAPSIPVIDLPELPVPAPSAPSVEAPSVPSLPSIPSIPMPTLPDLPFGGLFGSGS
ncbi:hypothetical protein [Mycolicibacterium litorale]|uniref:hypothetical protein n=1 Tax=Mycolicibacterium litorale TaxID=758802 RepID=UPI0039A3A268